MERPATPQPTDSATPDCPALERTLIDDPRLWRLYLMVSSDSIDVMLFHVTDDSRLSCHHIPLDSSISDPVKRLEEAVYQHPLLLADFTRVSVLVDTDTYMVVPAPVAADTDLLRLAIDAQWPDGSNLCPVTSDIDGQNATIVALLPEKTLGFLRRTFNNPRISHRLTPLCRYFLDKSRIGNTGKMYAHLRPDRMDLLVFGRGDLRMANTFHPRQPIDGVYYIMSSRASLSLDNSADELILSGDRATRDAITPMLREYVASVMPAIFPSAMLRAGSGVAQAPFELLILPLCE